MGKTMKGAVWLDPEKTSPYEFYQYWRNIEDVKVEECLGLLTFLPMEEVRRLGALEGAEINKAKEVLAYEITKIVHGEEEAEKAQAAARALFVQGGKTADIPTTSYPAGRAGRRQRYPDTSGGYQTCKEPFGGKKTGNSRAVFLSMM